MTAIANTATGWQVSGPLPSKTARIVHCHGDPFQKTQRATLDPSVRKPGTFLVPLLNAGYTVHMPWFGANWGGPNDPYGEGGHGIGVIDTIFPTGPVHLIGLSMGGCNAAVWASHNVSRVASLTLISPGLDILALWDRFDGNVLLFGLAREIGSARCADADATRATLETQLETDGDDIDTITAALAPIAHKIWVVSEEGDPLVPVQSVKNFAAAVGVPESQAVFFTSGTAAHHPAPYHLPKWEPLRPLRQVARWDR